MANNFAEAFLGARDRAQDRVRQQAADQRANEQFDLQMQGAQQKQQTDQREALYSLASGYKSYIAQNPTGGQQYYERFLRPSLAGLGLGDSGPYDEASVNQVADQVIAAYRPQTAQAALAPRVVGDALVDSTGKVLYQSPQKQDYQWSDRAGAWIPRPMAPQASSGVDPSGQAYNIEPGLSPEDMEAVQADIAASGQQNAYRLPPRAQGGLQAIPVSGISPKVDEAPAETFGQPQAVTGPDGRVQYVQFGNRGGTREVQGYSAPPTDRDAKPPTEGERKAATLLQRLTGSLAQLETAVREDPSAASPNLGAEAARRLPFVGEAAANTITPAARQRVEAAQLDILDAALTLGTGAAYTREQLEGYRRSYFPQIGDSESTIKDKAARLNNVIQAAEIAAGRANPENPERPAAPARNGQWTIQRVD